MVRRPMKDPAGRPVEVDRDIDALTLEARRLEKPAKRAAAPRFRKILACVDGTESARDVAAWAAAVAATSRARVLAVSVMSPENLYRHYEAQSGGRWDGAAAREADQEAAEASVASVQKACQEAGVACTSKVLEGFAGHELPRQARIFGADLIVIGSHGHHRFDRALLGSVADTVKTHAHCSVLVAKRRPGKKPVVAAVDGSRASKMAAEIAVRLSRSLGVPTRIVHGFPMPVFGQTETAVAEFRKILSGTRLPAGAKMLQYRLVLDRPARAILNEAQEADADLIVMGSRGLGAVRSLLIGSTSNAVSHEAKTSVLIVRT